MMAAEKAQKQTCNKAFLKLGFMEVNAKSECVVCKKVLSEELLEKNKFVHDLMTNHLGCVSKPIEYFKSKLLALSSQTNLMEAFISVNKLAVYASYLANVSSYLK